jgi:hypothetical protein
MTAIDTSRTLLVRLANAGLSVRIDGGDLVVKPVDKLTAELRSELLAAKPSLLATLPRSLSCPDCGSWCLPVSVDAASFGYPPGRVWWCINRSRCGRIVWQPSTDGQEG